MTTNCLNNKMERTIKWNKYMSQMSNQNKNNNLNYLIDTTFSNVNRLFEEDDRTSYHEYYVPSVEIKDYNVLIDGNAFFEFAYKKFRRNL